MLVTGIAANPNLPALFGIPLDFILFALTLLGIAIFHRHTLRVELIGLGTIAVCRILHTRTPKSDPRPAWALTNLFQETRSVGRWLWHGRFAMLAYMISFPVMLWLIPAAGTGTQSALDPE